MCSSDLMVESFSAWRIREPLWSRIVYPSRKERSLNKKGAITRALFDPASLQKLRGGGISQSGLGFAHKSGESGCIVHGEVGKNLAVQLDAGLLEAVDEL